MELVQFAIPQRLGAICAEAVTRLAGGATLLEAGLGLWVNGNGEVERERISWLIVGVEGDKVDEVIETVKSILRSGGESAIFFVRQKPTIENL
jgi:ribosomal protein L12E/L44/L45/RPP1/RPP2